MYRTPFSLEGVPKTSHFIARPAEMAKLEQTLLPHPHQSQRQKIHVLCGLGGMGKTQLAVEFARQYHRRFSTVFWLDGQNEDSLKRSIASCAKRIPQDQIADKFRTYDANNSVDIDAAVRAVMVWLAQTDNTAWLLIFDNVDREYNEQGGDSQAYDIKRYFSGADHGSVLITTRLTKLKQLSQTLHQLGTVDDTQARHILESWYKKENGKLE